MGSYWGAAIEVNGVRPDWLRDDEEIQIETSDGYEDFGKAGEYGPQYAGDSDWWSDNLRGRIVKFYLPADHPYYVAAEKGFTYWPGGDAAPADWDGGEVLLADPVGTRPGPPYPGQWTSCERSTLRPIIGYRKKATTAKGYGHVGLAPIRDTVTVPTLSAADLVEARRAYLRDAEVDQDSATFYARRWGLIREETVAERFSRETGHAVTPAVEAALKWMGDGKGGGDL